MALFETLLNGEMAQRVGWALVHFLWQGTAVAILCAIALMALRKAKPGVRYGLACFGLATMVIVCVVTFFVVEVDSRPAAVVMEAKTVSTVKTTQNQPTKHIVIDEPVQSEIAAKTPFWKIFAAQIERFIPWVVVGWFVGVCVLSFWYLGSWCQLQKLRRIGCKPINEQIAERASQLASQLGIHKTVRIVESVLVQVPTVIGWLKPVVMIPASAMTGLDEVQLSALIAHELAHVKRWDYLVNLFQVLMEILGFYHPAVWWLSKQIRIERENCCDDLAVSVLQNRKQYATALFSMAELRATQWRLAVAANGGELTDRISRLAKKESGKDAKSGWLASVVTAILIGGLVFAMSCTANLKKEDKPVSKQDMKAFFASLKNEQAVIQSFYFENEEIKERALPYLKDVATKFDTLKNFHIIEITPQSDNTYDVFGIFQYPRREEYVQRSLPVVVKDNRYQFKIFTKESLEQIEDQIVMAKTKTQKEIGQYHYEKQLNEWTNAEGEELNKLIQSHIQQAQQHLKATEYAKANNLKLMPNISNDEINKQLDMLKNTPPEQLKQEIIGELSRSEEHINTDNSAMESMQHMKQLALACHMFAEDNDSKTAPSMETLKPYLKLDEYDWLVDNAVLLPVDLQGDNLAMTPLGYDKTFLEEHSRRIIAFGDGHVEIDKNDGLKELLDEAIEKATPPKQILTTGYIIQVPLDFPELKNVLSDDSSKAKMITPDEFKEFIGIVQADPQAKILANPGILSNDNEDATIQIGDDSAADSFKLTIKNHVSADAKTLRTEIRYTRSQTTAENRSISEVSTISTVLSGHGIVASAAPAGGAMELLLIQPKIVKNETPETKAVRQMQTHSNDLLGGGMGGGGMMRSGFGGTVHKSTSKAVNSEIEIEIENAVHDFGQMGPGVSKSCEFKFTNIGSTVLNIDKVQSTCGCTVPELEKMDYAPGESGVILVDFKAPTRNGKVKKYLYIISTDPEAEPAKLTVKAEVMTQIEVSPKEVVLRLDAENAGMPEITLKSLDGVPFSIKRITMAGSEMDPACDPSAKVKVLNFTPIVDIERLAEATGGVIFIETDHPIGGRQLVHYSTLPYYEVSRPRMIVQNTRPGQKQIEKVLIRGHYGKVVKIKSSQSVNGYMEIVGQHPKTKQVELEIGITPPNENKRYFTDEMTIVLEDGHEITIRCSGFNKLEGTTTETSKIQPAQNLLDDPKAIHRDEINYPRNWDKISKRRGEADITARYETPKGMHNKVFDVSDLIILPSDFMPEKSGMGPAENGLSKERLDELVHTIKQGIVPSSWYEKGGDGRINVYGDSKLLVWQSPEIHKEIETLLEKTREETHKQIAIEARILLVEDNFLEEVGMDIPHENIGTVIEGSATDEKIIAAMKNIPLNERPLPAATTPFTTLDDQDVKFLLRATKVHSNAKTLTAPKAMVLNNESATMEVTTAVRCSGIGDSIIDIDKGIQLCMQPTAQDDDQEVLLRGHIRVSDILETQTLKNGNEEYSNPVVQVTSIPIHTLIKNQHSILISGPMIKVTQKSDDKKSELPVLARTFSNRSAVTEKRQILVLIKPTIVHYEEQEMPAVKTADGIGVLAGAD